MFCCPPHKYRDSLQGNENAFDSFPETDANHANFAPISLPVKFPEIDSKEIEADSRPKQSVELLASAAKSLPQEYEDLENSISGLGSSTSFLHENSSFRLQPAKIPEKAENITGLSESLPQEQEESEDSACKPQKSTSLPIENLKSKSQCSQKIGKAKHWESYSKKPATSVMNFYQPYFILPAQLPKLLLGTILRLPPYTERIYPGTSDPELNKGAWGHPVVVLGTWELKLGDPQKAKVAIVVCTSFDNFGMEGICWRKQDNKVSLEHIQIDSGFQDYEKNPRGLFKKGKSDAPKPVFRKPTWVNLNPHMICPLELATIGWLNHEMKQVPMGKLMDVICALEASTGGNERNNQIRLQIVTAWNLAQDKRNKDSNKQDLGLSIAWPMVPESRPQYYPNCSSWRMSGMTEQATCSKILTTDSLKLDSSPTALKPRRDSAIDLRQDLEVIEE